MSVKTYVTPFYKKSGSIESMNYRPTSVTSTFAKILEKKASTPTNDRTS